MAMMSVSLTDDLKEFIRDEVATGEYSSASEVVREAIRDFKHARLRQRLETDIKLATRQEESGLGTKYESAEAMMEASDRRLKAREDAAGKAAAKATADSQKPASKAKGTRKPRQSGKRRKTA